LVIEPKKNIYPDYKVLNYDEIQKRGKYLVSEKERYGKGISQQFFREFFLKHSNEIPTSCRTPSTNDHWGFHMSKLKYHRRWLNKR